MTPATDHEPPTDPSRDHDLSKVLIPDPAALPSEIRSDWVGYIDGTVAEMWARPGLSPIDRSLVAVAALATLPGDGQLRTHVELAVHHGVSRRSLCEVMMQVAGYAGIGAGYEGMCTLGRVFGESNLSDPGDESPDETTPVDALTDGLRILEQLRPGRDPLSVQYPFAPDWRRWLVSTAFGRLWTRPHLTFIQHERVTIAVLVALGREQELRDHIDIARTLGITGPEIGEELMHLAVYVGFPRVVSSLRIAAEVLD